MSRLKVICGFVLLLLQRPEEFLDQSKKWAIQKKPYVGGKSGPLSAEVRSDFYPLTILENDYMYTVEVKSGQLSMGHHSDRT